MQVLIAEDEAVSSRLLQSFLGRWGYEVIVTSDGAQAWAVLQQPGAPQLAVLDWMMPGMDGIEVCRRAHALERARRTYILMLTTKGHKGDIVSALEAGADDYLTKPFDPEELRARLHVGVRMLQLQTDLSNRVRELEHALTNVKLLQGLLPICCYCKKVRNDQDYWQQVEHYICDHSEAQFSHGICPDCYERVVKPQLAGLR